MEGPSSSTPPTTADSDDDDSVLANSEYLTHQELLKRRARRLRRLSKCYRDHYWSLMEALRHKHREYYWIYGKSPYREEGEDEVRENGIVTNNLSCSSNKNGKKLGLQNGSYSLCSVPNCNGKAMALSRYCFEHILLDSKQVLYKGCIFPHKRSDEHGVGPILCNKPLLKFTTPPFCARHSQDARKHISQALRKGGVSVSLSSKLSSKLHFHLVIKEYVNLIQSRRRVIASRNVDSIAVDNNGS